MRAAGVPFLGLNGKTCRKVRSQSVTSCRLCWNIASVSVGKPAIRSAPKTMSGRRRRASSQKAMASSRAWRRFMRFRIMLSPACSDRCRCGISRGSVAMACIRAGSASMLSIELIRSRGRSGTSRRMRFTRSPRRGCAGRSPPHEVRSTPVKTTSLKPLPTSRLICSTTTPAGTLRELPRPNGMMQNVQR